MWPESGIFFTVIRWKQFWSAIICFACKRSTSRMKGTYPCRFHTRTIICLFFVPSQVFASFSLRYFQSFLFFVPISRYAVFMRSTPFSFTKTMLVAFDLSNLLRFFFKSFCSTTVFEHSLVLADGCHYLHGRG